MSNGRSNGKLKIEAVALIRRCCKYFIMGDDKIGPGIALTICALFLIACILFVVLMRLAKCCCWGEKDDERPHGIDADLLEDNRPVEVF